MPGPIDRDEFARRFKAAREATRLSQAEAARRLDMPAPRLAEYEGGVRIPPFIRLTEIVATLGLDPRILMPEWFAGQSRKKSRDYP